MGESIALFIINHLRSLPGEIVLILLSALPVTELRASIPVAFTMMSETWNWPWWKVYSLAVFGNMLPVPFILALLGPVSTWLSRWKIFARFFNWLFERTRKRVGPHIKKYEAFGLAVFVAIPLPVTGAWTGSAAAFLFDIPKKKAIPSIFVGVLIAGTIITLIVKGALEGLNFLL